MLSNANEAQTTEIDLPLLERWQTGWSMSRGVPLPVREAGGLRVEVGMPLQVRRYVFLDAGPALQRRAEQIHTPHVYLKAAVGGSKSLLEPGLAAAITMDHGSVTAAVTACGR